MAKPKVVRTPRAPKPAAPVAAEPVGGEPLGPTPEESALVAIIDEQAGAAGEAVEMDPEPPEPEPTEVDDKTTLVTPDATRHRVEAFLSDARYFLSTLEHPVGGKAGEIIAYLRANL